MFIFYYNLSLICLGYCFLFGIALIILINLINHLLPKPRIGKCHDGSWAVITGATDGIGLAFAKVLYKRSYNLLLISRNNSKLIKTKDMLMEMPEANCQVEILEIDFSKSSDDIYANIESTLEKLSKIKILLNNVGICYERPEYFLEIPNLNKFIMDIINVNIVTMTRMTALVMPRMVSQKDGFIINMSSGSAHVPTPLLSLYSSTKVYMDFLSRSLAAEYRSRGVVIQSLTPYYVSTPMSHRMRTTVWSPSADSYAKYAIDCMGYEWNTGYWSQNMMNIVIGVPHSLSFLLPFQINKIITFNKMRGIHKRIKRKFSNQNNNII